MQHNGITHVHAIQLVTFDPKDKYPQRETVYVPDWMYHAIQDFIKTVPRE